MDYKVGNKVLCKKYYEYISDYPSTSKCIYNKGTYYIITEIKKIDGLYFKINSSNNKGIYFSNHKNDVWYMWDYFYTKEEDRRFKLEKLNGI